MRQGPGTDSGSGAPLLDPIEGFRIWAPTYDEETGLSALDERAARTLTPDLGGRSLLDAGCGTGRRLASALDGGAGLAVGVDRVPEMLHTARRVVAGDPVPAGDREGSARDGAPRLLAVGDVRALPLAAGRFDVVWCRLTLGFVPDPATAVGELGRVARPGGRVLVTDLHPECGGEGCDRSFRDASGAPWRIRHHLHAAEDHLRAAADAGLRLERRLDLEVGPEIRRFYREAGALDRYQADRGRPVLLALLFVRGT